MNGVDPAPQDVTLQDGLFAQHRVKALVYNEQVTDSVTQSFLQAAEREGVPVVGVYETMPTPDTTTSRGCSPRCARCAGRSPKSVSTETL